jgi:Flp pilus assembly CpaF family ATPase
VSGLQWPPGPARPDKAADGNGHRAANGQWATQPAKPGAQDGQPEASGIYQAKQPEPDAQNGHYPASSAQNGRHAGSTGIFQPGISGTYQAEQPEPDAQNGHHPASSAHNGRHAGSTGMFQAAPPAVLAQPPPPGLVQPAQASPAQPGPGPSGSMPANLAQQAQQPGSWPPRLPQPAAPLAKHAGPASARREPTGITEPRLLAGVSEVLAMIAAQLPDRAAQPDVMPLIRDAVMTWTQRLVRQGAPVPAPEQLDALAQAVYDQRYGLGPLAAYLRDRDVENVDVNGCDRVWVTYATGERVAAPPIASSDEALADMIRTWATRGGQTARDFSAASPIVNVGLVGGARLTGTMSVTPRPCLSLRRHGQLNVSLDDMIKLGSVDPVTAAFLAAAVKARCNIIVTGGVNAGKTTMLRALASEISPSERIATLETEYELFLHEREKHPDVIAFEAREANSEGAGSVSLHDLIAHALRHNPHRILVGEVRRSEIMPMLEAMNSGQDGSMCTMHANSPVEAFDRILILGLRGGLALTERAIHILVGMAVDLIVQMRRSFDGRRTVRFVSEILEVMPPGDTDRPAVNRLFLPNGPGGRAVPAHTPSPGMLSKLQAAGFAPHLLDQRPPAQPAGWGNRVNR